MRQSVRQPDLCGAFEDHMNLSLSDLAKEAAEVASLGPDYYEGDMLRDFHARVAAALAQQAQPGSVKHSGRSPGRGVRAYHAVHPTIAEQLERIACHEHETEEDALACLEAAQQAQPLTDPLAPCPYCGSQVPQSLLDDGFREMNMQQHGFSVIDAKQAQPAKVCSFGITEPHTCYELTEATDVTCLNTVEFRNRSDVSFALQRFAESGGKFDSNGLALIDTILSAAFANNKA